MTLNEVLTTPPDGYNPEKLPGLFEWIERMLNRGKDNLNDDDFDTMIMGIDTMTKNAPGDLPGVFFAMRANLEIMKDIKDVSSKEYDSAHQRLLKRMAPFQSPK